ncbi:MAG: tetratricopeptide repeat protein [Proteobacteria bacterium]|nr:tetratricopeptide repeat protein [Pseudomonadota bacterium]MBU4582114.1 tetratricopeptide repeat protein [Pseudomonadota bacterium]MCG2742144.1 tetratricopeptide repeat protein [Syntrophaceae bacterium]
MGKTGQKLFAGLPVAILLLVAALLLSSCALPKIVVMEDRLTAEQHNDLGYVYEQKGIFDLAEKEYLLAVKKREDWQVPYFNLGNLMFKIGDFKKSEKFFRTTLNYNPNNSDVMNNLANALLMQERHREARQVIEQALRIENKQEYLDTLRTIEKRESAAPQ